MNDRGTLILSELAVLKKETAMLKKKQSKIQESATTMNLVQEKAITILSRVFYSYCKLMGHKSWNSTQIIREGNKIAHVGNFISDTVLMKCGDLGDTTTFCMLYGVCYESAQLCLGMYTFVIIVDQVKYTGISIFSWSVILFRSCLLMTVELKIIVHD